MSSGDSFISLYKRVIEALNKNEVEYMIVGGFAVNYHGYFRATADMDIWINKAGENLEKLYHSFIQLGYSKDNSKNAVNHFQEEHIISLPLEENDLVEILDSFIMQSDFTKAWPNRETVLFEEVRMVMIGYQDLIESKSKSSRFKDQNDVQELKKIRKDNEE